MVLKHDVLFPVMREEKKDLLNALKNPTVIPDDLFETIRPIIIIRHPALVSDSFMKVQRGGLPATVWDQEHLALVTTFKLGRFLFDFFSARGRSPVVVDGEDILWRTDEVGEKVCDLIGIDAATLKEEWSPFAEHERPHQNPYFYVSIHPQIICLIHLQSLLTIWWFDLLDIYEYDMGFVGNAPNG
jgi:hypothetical protein